MGIPNRFDKIYILLATYNGEKYLCEQIDSIIAQTHQNWELFIHDDNSTDNTVKLILEYKQKYPNKIRFYNDEISTNGAKENFSYLLKAIDNQFDYIMFCDQDDVWLENKIELTLDKMNDVKKRHSNIPIIIHTDLKITDHKLKVISKSMFDYQMINYRYGNSLKKICLENVVTGCTMLINKNAFSLVADIPDEAIMHDWWISILVLKNKGKIFFLDKSTVLYRQHEQNVIGAMPGDQYRVKLLSIIFNPMLVINQYKKLSNQYKKAEVKIRKGEFALLISMMILKKIFK